MSETSDTPEIRPALTREQWERRYIERDHGHIPGIASVHTLQSAAILHGGPWGGGVELHNHVSDPVVVTPADLYALAALCLHGHPAGFTWEDVDIIRAALPDWSGMATDDDGNMEYVGDRFSYERMNSLADRIAALLPPREE